jgi:hypothetical protein
MIAGKYYVGDLCYVMNDEEWREVCNLTIVNHTMVNGEFNLPDGRRFAMYSTAYGDGEYLDQDGRSYCVDSGSIGCILLSDIKTQNYKHIEELGNHIEFKNDFVTDGDNGIMRFGHITIDTASMNDWDEYDEEEYDEEETD